MTNERSLVSVGMDGLCQLLINFDQSALDIFLAQQANYRRAQLAGMLRSLARALEVPTWPFTNCVAQPDPDECRGQAEREIDALAAHIQRLEEERKWRR